MPTYCSICVYLKLAQRFYRLIWEHLEILTEIKENRQGLKIYIYKGPYIYDTHLGKNNLWNQVIKMQT